MLARVGIAADGKIVLAATDFTDTVIVARFDGGSMTDPAGEDEPAESHFASPDRLFSLEGDDKRRSAFDIFSSTVLDLLDGDTDDEDNLIVAPD